MEDDNPSAPIAKLQPLAMNGGHFNIKDNEKFLEALSLLKESLFDDGASMFCSDNLITWNKNLSFLRDERFLQILADPKAGLVDQSIIWRTYILLYFANLSLDLDGDFVECGTYEGHTASWIFQDCNLENSGKQFWLYDLFEWTVGDQHTKLPEHSNPELYKKVASRFSQYPNVNIIKGSVPASFSEGFPDEIAFCHIDMNHHVPEAGALQAVLPKLVKGGSIVFDDYGWWGYSKQKAVLDPIAESFGQQILELPTGQGIMINR